MPVQIHTPSLRESLLQISRGLCPGSSLLSESSSQPPLQENNICLFSHFLSDFDFTTETNKLSSEKGNYEVNSYHRETMKRSKTLNLMRFVFRNDPQWRIEFGREWEPKLEYFSQMIFRKHISLPLHQRIHTREKYECQDCRKDFRKYSHLTEHLRDHSDVRLYECKECGKAFIVLQHFIRHKKNTRAG